MAFGLVVSQTTAVNIALPAIGSDLDASVSVLQWCANAYTLLFAGLLLPAGAVVDRFGSWRTCSAGLLIVVAGSSLAAVAPHPSWVVVGRGIGGVGAAVVVPAATALIRDVSVGAEAQARGVAMIGMGGAVGFGSGPVLAGAMLAALGWRGVFVAASVVAVVVLVALRRVPRPAHPEGRAAPDALGAVLIVATIGGLTMCLSEAGRASWGSPAVLGSLVAFLAAASALVRHVARHPLGMLPARLFARPDSLAVLVLAVAFNATTYGMLFVLSFVLQRTLGLSPLEAALALAPQAIGAVLVTPLAARWLFARSARYVLRAGMVATSAGFLVLAATESSHVVAWTLVGLAVAGAGGGLIFPGLTAGILDVVPAALSGTATAAMHTGRQVGGVLGVALVGPLLNGDALAGLRLAALVSAALIVTLIALTAAVPRGAIDIGPTGPPYD